ncbi:uncharacterized protein BP5553_08983 [Venustampulla echinocandica]|uniref:Uncharacterized protein n=1 Tax=Venustampulla echinocandica TaxID=2656787 RepID=A0A370TDK5_9HELO|nr:uncharacterized protein BP5553_08983 [Venustampulla echinocandica]RDL32527.1 hypothetical protein BP5553_08983 [Venustampulla echinocandica]
MASSSSLVEANSLSDITQLASHPPKYPRNPTEQRRVPLTLYIARVPGSRDIILTPLKPQLKNVAVQDVASSLYYLHLNSEDDTRLLGDDQTTVCDEPDPRAGTSDSVQKPVPRKPLPQSARASLDVPQADVASSRTDSPSNPSNIKTESPNMIRPLQDSAHVNKPVQRRLLGPRALPSAPSIERKPLARTEDGLVKASQDAISNSRASNDTLRNALPQEPGFRKSEDHQHIADTFSITLIRRDPASGAQWNIGSISGHPINNESPHRPTKSPVRSKKPYFDISVELTTPGYTPFRNSQPIAHPSKDLPVVGQQLSTTKAAKTGPNRAQPQGSSVIPSSFHRQVFMEGSNSWGRPSTKHKRTPSDLSGKRGRGYSGSSAIGYSDTMGTDQEEEAAAHMPRPKGYIFLSPWEGRCKFSTGSGGRSLRCRHTLPSPVSAINTADSSASTQPSVLLSELRFNLPSSALFGSSKSPERSRERSTDFKGATATKFRHIRNKLSSEIREYRASHSHRHSDDEEDPPALPPRPNLRFTTNSSDEANDAHIADNLDRVLHVGDEENSRLDLSLGQEKAGGGNRGKRAKLGKLIIHDEGFKMLDLVVAANMGIWWSTWDSDHR